MAREVLLEAPDVAKKGEPAITLWRILANIGKLNAAQEIMESIARTVSDATLRETFRKYNR